MASLFLGLFLILNCFCGDARAAETPDYMGVFKTSSRMAVEWKVDDGSGFVGFSTEEVHSVEMATRTYYVDLLSQNGLSVFQSPNRFVDVQIGTTKQALLGDNLAMDMLLDTYHVGDSGIANLSDLLRFVTNKNTTGSEEFRVLDSLIGMGINIRMVSFADSTASEALAGGFASYYMERPTVEEGDGNKYTESERTLIVVTSVLSFALFALSVILIWVAGGWLALRKQVEVLMNREEERNRVVAGEGTIEQKETQDTESDTPHLEDDETHFTNPSGILGGNPYYGGTSNAFDGLGVKMTPPRQRHSDMDSSDLETPMSEYSDSGRLPIGIQSMRKLLAKGDEDPSDDIRADPLGMKRLDFDE